MNDLRKRWVEALRSGKYEQGRGQLRTIDDKYCCLGVACEVYGVKWYEATTFGVATRYGLPQPYSDYPEQLNCSGLPLEIADALGVPQIPLIEMNDQYENTFEEIADYIEALPV